MLYYAIGIKPRSKICTFCIILCQEPKIQVPCERNIKLDTVKELKMQKPMVQSLESNSVKKFKAIVSTAHTWPIFQV